MPTNESAISEALAIPEIVSSIFDAVCHIPRWKHFQTLLSCTLVNSIWHNEANRRLWDHCGKNTDIFNIPTIESLLKLDISTRQKFANYIRCIHISNTDLPDGRLLWQGQHLPKLADLSFHRLQEVYLDGPMANDPTSYQTPVLTQFAQPNLRKVQIYGTYAAASFGITEEWIEQLTKISRDIRHFHFVGRNNFRISPAIFLSFLKNMHSLESLEWELDESMSEAAFTIMAQSISLRCLRIRSIADTWLQNEFQTLPLSSLFKNLVELSCQISANGLDLLVIHLKALTMLSLQVSDDTTRVLKTLSHCALKNLEELRLQSPPDNIIQGRDLLTLASNLPQLLVLDVTWNSDGIEVNFPLIQNVSNNVMEDLATLLPKLRELYLISAEDTSMTEKSLISLGKHCPDLLICKLTAIVDYNNLVNEKENVVWEQLKTLSIHGSGMQPEDEEEDVILELSKRIRKAMPSLESAVFQMNWQVEEALNGLIGEEEI